MEGVGISALILDTGHLILDKGNNLSGRNTARATLGEGLAVSAFPLYVPV